MIANRLRNRTQLAASRGEIAREMPAADGPREIGEPVQDEDPGEEEVPRPRHRQPAVVRNCEPPWERAMGKFAVTVFRGPEHAGCVEIAPEHPRDPMDAGLRRHVRSDREDRALPGI